MLYKYLVNYLQQTTTNYNVSRGLLLQKRALLSNSHQNNCWNNILKNSQKSLQVYFKQTRSWMVYWEVSTNGHRFFLEHQWTLSDGCIGSLIETSNCSKVIPYWCWIISWPFPKKIREAKRTFLQWRCQYWWWDVNAEMSKSSLSVQRSSV